MEALGQQEGQRFDLHHGINFQLGNQAFLLRVDDAHQILHLLLLRQFGPGFLLSLQFLRIPEVIVFLRLRLLGLGLYLLSFRLWLGLWGLLLKLLSYMQLFQLRLRIIQFELFIKHVVRLNIVFVQQFLPVIDHLIGSGRLELPDGVAIVCQALPVVDNIFLFLFFCWLFHFFWSKLKRIIELIF